MKLQFLFFLLSYTCSSCYGFEKAPEVGDIASGEVDDAADAAIENQVSQFENKKERKEFFNKLKKTGIPLTKTGLPITGKDPQETEDNLDFIEDALHSQAAEQPEDFAMQNGIGDEDAINELEIASDEKPKMDPKPKPAWPCRRRRWWGSCGRRRRVARRRRVVVKPKWTYTSGSVIRRRSAVVQFSIRRRAFKIKGTSWKARRRFRRRG